MNAMKKLICLLLMLCAGTAAFAWGGREHRLIAYIAEAHLTPRTRQVLPEPLRPNGDGDAVRQLTRAIERLRN